MLRGSPYFAAFARMHNINGKNVMCILAKSHDRSFRISVDGSHMPGVYHKGSVLLVKASEVYGMQAGESLRVDGELMQITRISRPIEGVIRLELDGCDG